MQGGIISWAVDGKGQALGHLEEEMAGVMWKETMMCGQYHPEIKREW